MKAAAAVPRRIAPPPLNGMEQLSGLIAHELNNIAVPLSGFVGLVSENVHDAGAIRQCIEEVQIGIDRLSEIALELQGLAESHSVPAIIPVSDCLVTPDDDAARMPIRTRWACDAQALVVVDLQHARRVVGSLARMSNQTSVLSVGDVLAARSTCSTCGARLSPAKSFIQVQACAVRGAIVNAIRHPFEAGHKLRAPQRLMIAAFVKAAHLAGGHIVAIDGTDCVSLILPRD